MSLRSLLFDPFAWRRRPSRAEALRAGVSEGGERVQELVATTTVSEITVDDINRVLEGRLWMLDPTAFLYYLPALMYTCLVNYRSVSVFASELLGALTEPSRS